MAVIVTSPCPPFPPYNTIHVGPVWRTVPLFPLKNFKFKTFLLSSGHAFLRTSRAKCVGTSFLYIEITFLSFPAEAFHLLILLGGRVGKGKGGAMRGHSRVRHNKFRRTTHLLTHLPIHLSTHLPTHLPNQLLTHLPTHLPTHFHSLTHPVSDSPSHTSTHSPPHRGQQWPAEAKRGQGRPPMAR